MAGGAALNELIPGPRISRDIDLFHDTDEAVATSWDADRRLLERHNVRVSVVRERPSYVEAEVSAAGESVRVEWARDSAYRFFPLVRHDELGLVLHPFDLATNKVLALVGVSKCATGSTSSTAPSISSPSDTWRGRPAERIRGSVQPRFSSTPLGRAIIRRTK